MYKSNEEYDSLSPYSGSIMLIIQRMIEIDLKLKKRKKVVFFFCFAKLKKKDPPKRNKNGIDRAQSQNIAAKNRRS